MGLIILKPNFFYRLQISLWRWRDCIYFSYWCDYYLTVHLPYWVRILLPFQKKGRWKCFATGNAWVSLQTNKRRNKSYVLINLLIYLLFKIVYRSLKKTFHVTIKFITNVVLFTEAATGKHLQSLFFNMLQVINLQLY